MASIMQEMYVGLDVHKKFIQGCVLDKEGKVILEQKFKNEPHSMNSFLSNIKQDSMIALESCSCRQYVHDYLNDAGFKELVLANPSISQSGDKFYAGHISKQGSSNLRWMLIECANTAVMHDSNPALFYHRIKKRKNHKAAAAAARRLLAIIYAMLMNNRNYTPQRKCKAS